MYVYAQNNPVSIQYSTIRIGVRNLVTISNLANRKYLSSNNRWIALQPLPSWLDKVITGVDIGFSLSIVARTGWYTLRYPGVADLMKLDGITEIPGKYTEFVKWLGYGLAVLDTGLDFYSNVQQGQSTGYVIGSAAYTLGTDLGIMWLSGEIGSYIGTAIGGPVGYIVGGLVGIAAGLFLDWLADKIKEWIF